VPGTNGRHRAGYHWIVRIPLGAAVLIVAGVVATILVIFVDGGSTVFGVVGILVLAFVVLFGAYATLRLLLTKPARRLPPDLPGADVPRTWGYGAFDPDHQPKALWGPRVWRWSRPRGAGAGKPR